MGVDICVVPFVDGNALLYLLFGSVRCREVRLDVGLDDSDGLVDGQLDDFIEALRQRLRG
jgi:hypothetical protein